MVEELKVDRSDSLLALLRHARALLEGKAPGRKRQAKELLDAAIGRLEEIQGE